MLKCHALMNLKSPYGLSESVGVSNFIVINLETLTFFFENASIESETPGYFQVDNLYRIAVTEVGYEHHFL